MSGVITEHVRCIHRLRNMFGAYIDYCNFQECLVLDFVPILSQPTDHLKRVGVTEGVSAPFQCSSLAQCLVVYMVFFFLCICFTKCLAQLDRYLCTCFRFKSYFSSRRIASEPPGAPPVSGFLLYVQIDAQRKNKRSKNREMYNLVVNRWQRQI